MQGNDNFSAEKKTATAYLIAALVICGLFFNRAYFNIVEAKAVVVQCSCAILLCVMAGVCLYYGSDRKKEKRSVLPMDIFFLIFTASTFLSCFFAPSFLQGFLGTSGWQTGSMCYILLFLVYLFMSRYMNVKMMKHLALPVQGIICLWSFINSCGVDVFGMHRGIVGKDADYSFLSSIGNANSMATYVCLLLPVTLYWFLKHRGTKGMSAGYIIVLALSLLCALGSNSSSVLVGLFAACGCIFVCILNDALAVKRMGIFLMIFGLCGGLVYALLRYLPGFVPLEGEMRLMITSCLWVGFAVFGAVLFVVGAKFPRLFEKRGRVLHMVCAAVFVCVVITAVVYCVKIFDFTWGSYRGYIWRICGRMFKDFSWKNRIFGIGCDCFGVYFPKYGTQMHRIWDMNVLNAHNQFLQVLMTQGLTGIVSWLMLFIGTFVCAFRCRKSECTAAVFGLVGYVFQSIFNVPYAYNMMLVGLLLSLLAFGFRKDPYEKKENAAISDGKVRFYFIPGE